MAVELDPTLIPPPFVNYRYVVVDDNGAHPPLPEGGAKSGRCLTLVLKKEVLCVVCFVLPLRGG